MSAPRFALIVCTLALLAIFVIVLFDLYARIAQEIAWL